MTEPKAQDPAGTPARAAAPARPLDRLFRRSPGHGPGNLLAGFRVRKKLMVLHTGFSLGLLLFMVVLLRPAVLEVVDRAETAQAVTLLQDLADDAKATGVSERTGPFLAALASAHYRVTETPATPGPSITTARTEPFRPVALGADDRRAYDADAVVYIPAVGAGVAGGPGRYHWLRTPIPEARQAVTRLYVFTGLALLAVYAFIAAALEVFVLPRSVYEPIRRTLEADRALREGRTEAEMIPESAMPADELGEIMRSRNESVAALRRQEAELNDALQTLESTANDLKRKNHLLEAARRNLADADRLASLGMMSAGIAHELNTPLAVVKGLAERLAADPARGLDEGSAALLVRVVGRLERLGESLLDFARVRPPHSRTARLSDLAEDAASLVRLDQHGAPRIEVEVPGGLEIACDADRIVQVLVNLIRNARDALSERGTGDGGEPRIEVSAGVGVREASPWVSIRVSDNGPGIDPAILPRLFEPFASTRLDARGTGLGLAVAEGIVREHGGVILASNRPGRSGAQFEVLLPLTPPAPAPPDGPPGAQIIPAAGPYTG